MNDADIAKRRFLALAMIRLTGTAIALFGVAILAGIVALPNMAGALLLIAGTADAVVVPILLARKWKSPRK